MGKADQHTVLFVSDTHFHLEPEPDEGERIALFLEFLEMARRADELVLLGDIFDFWFDYPHFRLKGYEKLLIALDEVRDSGTRMHFVGGNHDIWAADYMHHRFGCAPGGGSTTLETQGRRLRLVHGDGLLIRDRLYSTFRWLVRQRAGIALAKSLHPELLFAFSHWLSHTSRQVTRDEAATIERRAAAYLERKMGDWDLLLIGHLHHAFQLTRGDRTLAALGSWFDEASYGLLREGRFELLDFVDDPRPF